jgi:hypothetical protein
MALANNIYSYDTKRTAETHLKQHNTREHDGRNDIIARKVPDGSG